MVKLQVVVEYKANIIRAVKILGVFVTLVMMSLSRRRGRLNLGAVVAVLSVGRV